MKIVYQGEHSGVSVAVDGSTYLAFENDVPTDVPSSVGRKLVEENPTIWRTDEPPAEKPKKADKSAPDTKESK